MDSADKVLGAGLAVVGTIFTIAVMGFVLNNAGAINTLLNGLTTTAGSLAKVT